MSMPNRKQEVREAFQILHLRPIPKSDYVGRLTNLIGIISHLNTYDPGQWGLLYKEDRDPHTPSDIAVWKPTKEHVDVLTGDGQPTWIAHPSFTDPDWRVIDAPIYVPPTEPPDEPDPPRDYGPQIVALTELVNQLITRQDDYERALHALQATQTALTTRLDHFGATVIRVDSSRRWGHSHVSVFRLDGAPIEPQL